MKQILITGLILISQIGFSQLKEMNPTSTRQLDLSIAGEKEFNDNFEACKKIWGKMSNGVEYDDLSQQEKDALSKVDEAGSSIKCDNTIYEFIKNIFRRIKF